MYAGIVKNHHGDSDSAWRFADRTLQIGAQPGLLAEIAGSHEEAKRDVVAALQGLAKCLEACGAELDRTWRMYDASDHAAAEGSTAPTPIPVDPRSCRTCRGCRPGTSRPPSCRPRSPPAG